MENKKFLFVLFACALFASVLGGASKTAESNTSTSQAPSTSDPTTVDPSSSTTPPTTTPLPTTSSPPTPPPTTPPTPPTTPPTPPTTPPTPPPTTPVPAPTTVAPPTPAPSPVPSDGRGNWTVTVPADNVTCIIAQMIVSAKIDYPLQTINQTGKVKVSVPPTAKAEGSCDSASQFIKLTWDNNSIQVDFKKNDTTKMYYISQINFSFVADSNVFPNISTEFANKSLEFVRVKEDFMINLNQSFRCTREQVLPLPKNNSAIHAELALSSVQLQAFHMGNAVVFGAAQDCELDTPDIVPIAVGCALAALVCVVLVAYLVGRRRSQARGYLSM